MPFKHPVILHPRSCCIAYSAFVPHSSQNFAPGLSSCWQFAHFAGACEEPHSLQNFVPAFKSAPHFTHFTVAAVAAAPPEGSDTVAPRCLIASVIAPSMALPNAM